MNKAEMKEEAKKTYFWYDFHAITNKIKGMSDEDLDNLAPAIKQFILTSKEKEPIKMFYSVFDEIERIWSLSVPFPPWVAVSITTSFLGLFYPACETMDMR